MTYSTADKMEEKVQAMRDYTCTCIGAARGSQLPETGALKIQMEKLIEERGVRRFLCGMERGLELAFGELAAELRDGKYPFITLESVIPYEEQAAEWGEADRDRYYNLAARCDREKMLRRSFAQGCIIERDCYLLGQARYLILAEEGKFKTMVLDS